MAAIVQGIDIAVSQEVVLPADPDSETPVDDLDINIDSTEAAISKILPSTSNAKEKSNKRKKHATKKDSKTNKKQQKGRKQREKKTAKTSSKCKLLQEKVTTGLAAVFCLSCYLSLLHVFSVFGQVSLHRYPVL